MRSDPVMFQRFARETAGIVAADLRRWAIQALAGTLSAADRLTERDRLLRDASALLPEMAAWAKAKAIHAEMLALLRALPADPDLGTVRGCVAAAMLMHGTSLSLRQVYRLLQAH